MSRWERLRGAAYAAVLLWVNAYICRDWFFHPTAQMNSLDGYWAALARLGDGWLGAFLHPAWWPFWDFGIPFEFTSAPLVPVMTAAIAAMRHEPHTMALQAVSAIFYCAVPLSLFLMAWLLTRAPGYSFFAALFYGLLAPAQILAPDGPFSWANFFSPHRFMLQAAWDETPRCAALTFLLLFILFLARWMETRRPVYAPAAAISLALAMLASPFAALSAALAVLCLVIALDPASRRTNLIYAAGVGVLAYALAASFLPPSIWLAMGAASAEHEAWNMSLKVLAALVVGWLTLLHFGRRWIQDWRLLFFVLLAYAMSCGPVLATWLHEQFLPQAQRFRIEMESALALAAVFGLRSWVQRMPQTVKAALAFVVLSLAGEQVVNHRKIAKDVLYPKDVTHTIEYRIAQRVARDLPGARVMLPGSIAHWANAFTESPQFAGSEGTMAYSQVQQRAMTAVYQEDARTSLAWLKAYGAAAVVVSGPGSREFWKPFAHPEKFEGVLPAMWSEEGVTAYRVPQRTPSLAHVVPVIALVGRTPRNAHDIAEIDRYNEALDDPTLPEASFEWQGRNRIGVRATTVAVRCVVSKSPISPNVSPGPRALIASPPSPTVPDYFRPPIDGLKTMRLNISNSICAPTMAVVVLASYWGATSTTSRCIAATPRRSSSTSPPASPPSSSAWSSSVRSSPAPCMPNSLPDGSRSALSKTEWAPRSPPNRGCECRAGLI
jgi:hypothetical protein